MNEKIIFSKMSNQQEWPEFESIFYGPCECGKTFEQALREGEDIFIKMRWTGNDITRTVVCSACTRLK